MKGIHIILTSTINITKKQVKDTSISVKIKQTDPEERKACYLKAIKYWLDHTDFNITLVENSGYEYSELDEYKQNYASKFECISFDIHNEPDAAFIFNDFKYLSKGLLELYSIHYAYNHSRLIKEIPPSFIIKITGRYYISHFDTHLKKVDFNTYKSIRQEKDIFNRCEFVGCCHSLFKDFFSITLRPNELKHYMYVESIYKIRHEDIITLDKVFMFKKIALGWPTIRGGTTEVYKYF